jgi:hypothetical protein
MVFENRVLRRIFGPKREKDGLWRKMRNDELHSLYSLPNILGWLNQGGGCWRDMWHAWVWERCLQRFGWEARR